MSLGLRLLPTSSDAVLESLKGPPGSEYFRNAKAVIEPGRTVLCHDCHGFGQVRFRFGRPGERDWKRCLTCEGKGSLPARRPVGRTTRGLVRDGGPSRTGQIASDEGARREASSAGPT